MAIIASLVNVLPQYGYGCGYAWMCPPPTPWWWYPAQWYVNTLSCLVWPYAGCW